MNRQSILKLLRETLTEESPLPVQNTDPKTFLDQVAQRLLALEGVSVPRDFSFTGDDNDQARKRQFEMLDDSAHPWNNSFIFKIILESDHRLWLHYGDREPWPVGSIESLVAFCRGFQRLVQRRKTQAAKRAKLKKIKIMGITTQIRTLAREEAFDYLIEEDSVKLKLYVKLSEQHAVMILIPFSKFESLLPKLREAIRGIRELYNHGIVFHVKPNLGKRDWIRHTDQKDS